MPPATKSDFLSITWFEEILKLAEKMPKETGANLKIDFEINKTPKTHEMAGKKIRCLAEIADGKLKKFESGKLTDPQVSVRCEYKDALKVAKGELDIEVAYMQGVIKLDGAYEIVLFGLRDFFAGKPWINFLKQVRASL